METVNIHRAKTQLSKLIERVSEGEEIVIARGGKPVARLVPLLQRSQPRTPGALKGKIRIAEDFDAPLPDRLPDLFEGNAKPRSRSKARRAVRLLVDTHLLLWWLAGRRVPRRAAELIRDSANQVYASAASLWEVALKASLGKIEVEPGTLVEGLAKGGFEPLAVSWGHAARIADLPMHHWDPFDRLLVAQSLFESMPLLTSHRALAAYGPMMMVAA
ncbi:MAG TPA: type II toxin-antitoxin system prevent-host-death family antitoxin [Burkholderiales bacterium]|nr:type II toxin-antitoxin system prevent-host-death family antitoxin [Burkholderiales bacterium]